MMADARRAPLKDQTDISGARALIVEARFYDDIQDAMLEGAVAELKAAGVSHDVHHGSRRRWRFRRRSRSRSMPPRRAASRMMRRSRSAA